MGPTQAVFLAYDDSVREIFGSSPVLQLLREDESCPFAHEAAVFIPNNNTLFVTSNQFEDVQTRARGIRISKITFSNDGSLTKCEEINPAGVFMANGGVNYEGGVLFCSQGTPSEPSGLVFVQGEHPHHSRTIVKSFYGREFNSVNDVVIHTDGSIWFTDPIYGFEQGIRPRPRLPSQVYRLDPQSGAIRAMADGFGRPNGICFSPNEEIVYITDTDFIHGDGSTDESRASTIYAFDIVRYSGQPFLTNRRLFAMADTGVPDGIKCDTLGNVYSGCGDGVHIWSPGGVLLGKILVEGGVANLCFGRAGELFILNETRLWRAKLAPSAVGALLGDISSSTPRV